MFFLYLRADKEKSNKSFLKLSFQVIYENI